MCSLKGAWENNGSEGFLHPASGEKICRSICKVAFDCAALLFFTTEAHLADEDIVRLAEEGGWGVIWEVGAEMDTPWLSLPGDH